MHEKFLTQAGQRYGHYKLIHGELIDELKCFLREMIHEPTGAHLIHLENDDPENLFCLSFKTLPTSSNGVAHILEHTVLCGSRKYPVKDPFFAMNRRSLNTFMNAMTGSDFTCYPAASQVEKDFYNLLEVYLDAVFHPQLKELSFLQEGHHLGFQKADDPQSPLEFKGIVYNEMKGALSSIDSRIWHEISKELMPHLPYAYNSGGDPREIPDLTYAELIEFHETHYHPSRCLFFFYGNFPLKKHLDFLEEYAFKGVQKMAPLDGIHHQPRFSKPKRNTTVYPISETTDLENKTIHSFGFLTTLLLNQTDVLALTILDSVLMDTDVSPLKKRLLDSNLCIEVDSLLDTEMSEIPWVLLLRGCKAEDADLLEKTLFDALREIVKEGIPFPIVEASIHQLEFARTEIGGDHSPFGLTLFWRSGLAQQHGCDPKRSLKIYSLFEELIEQAKNPHFFSPLIEKYLLKNPHFVRLSALPDPQLMAQEADEEKKRLDAIRQALTQKQLAKVLTQTKELETFQAEQEKQKIECLPKVTLDDVPKEARHFALHEQKQSALEIFHHDVFTNHILYAELIFDLPALSIDELFDLQLFLILWPELGVGTKGYTETLEYIHAHTGGVGSHFSLHVQADDPTKIKPSIQLRGKALKRKADKLFHLFEEMVRTPRLDERKRIKEVLKRLATSMQNRLAKNAMRYASQLAVSSFSIPSYIHQQCYGLDFYNQMQHLAQNIDRLLPDLLERLVRIKEKVLCKGTPHLILSCEDELFHAATAAGFYGLPHIECRPSTPWKLDIAVPRVAHQARPIASPVAFVAQGYSTVSYLHPDAAALQVATLLFDHKVLHHRIREQGGAYGAGAHYSPLSGNFYFSSYRDPHIAHTVRTFDQAIDELSAGNFDETDLEEAKLGIIQQFDTPIAPGSRGATAYTWKRDGKTRHMRQTFRDRLLALTPKEVQSAIETHLKGKEHVTVAFAGKKLLDKELPRMEHKTLTLLPIDDTRKN